jgi:hypothetical protein
MNEKDDKITHPGMVSNPKKKRDFWPISEFAMNKMPERHEHGKKLIGKA